MTLILLFVPSQESHDRIMLHMSTGMCETGNQWIKVGSVLGKFSKYHGLCELCWFYLLEALSSAICSLSPGPSANAPVQAFIDFADYRNLSAHLHAHLAVLSLVFTSFRGIYAKQKVDRDTVLISNLSGLSSAKSKEI